MIVQGLPHACGGVSIPARVASLEAESSPRMWGCFRSTDRSTPAPSVFPTHVGVFLWH